MVNLTKIGKLEHDEKRVLMIYRFGCDYTYLKYEDVTIQINKSGQEIIDEDSEIDYEILNIIQEKYSIDNIMKDVIETFEDYIVENNLNIYHEYFDLDLEFTCYNNDVIFVDEDYFNEKIII